jgi:hypothetical protein
MSEQCHDFGRQGEPGVESFDRPVPGCALVHARLAVDGLHDGVIATRSVA